MDPKSFKVLKSWYENDISALKILENDNYLRYKARKVNFFNFPIPFPIEADPSSAI
jgi:hypothetical protein